MKVKCPKCGSTKNLKAMSRYLTFECCNCHKKFKGFEADVCQIDRIINIFNPFSNMSYDFDKYSKTHCTFCGKFLSMMKQEHGFYAPERCHRCKHWLDNEPAKQSDEAFMVI